VVIVDNRERPTRMNQAARTYLGSALDKVHSLTEAAVLAGLRYAESGQSISYDWSPIARALNGEVVSAEEYTLPRGADQQCLKLRISAIPLQDAYGRISGAVAIFARAEEHLSAERIARMLEAERGARTALQASQQRLRLALEASHMGTWDYDVVNDHIEWSAEMASVFGVSQEKLGGTLTEGLAHVHPDDQPLAEESIRQGLEKGNEFKIEVRVVSDAGEARWMLAKGRVYRDEQGRPLRMTGIAMDISERKEAEATRQALAQTERLRALGQMASGIAHDLNQSLALISGYSDMARQELLLDMPDIGRVREMVEITARAALEGGQALKGLLSFARTQELMAESEWVDLGDLLRDVARLTGPRWRDAAQAEGRPINLEVQTVPGCTVHGSPAALREAFTNLIFNAVDALPRGGSIFLHLQRVQDDALIEVRDTGTGIPRELQSRIFDPFFTTKGERGTGLGLPQVVAIVERHAGRIDVESMPGRGTTFRLRFPIVAPPVADVAEAAAEKSNGVSTRSIRVLVVEDEEQLAKMAALVLTQRGHHVVVATSGEEALERLREEPFELVISDLGLGTGKNGWDVAAAVRKNYPSTRFVLVTGWGAGIDPHEAREKGVEEVIAKPYRIADLRQIADRVAAEGGAP
jgi:PAS domain S-box-containing protein